MGIIKLAMIEFIRRPGRNGLIILSITIAVSLLTALTIVSESANTTILVAIERTGHQLTIRPATAAAFDESNIKTDNVTAADVLLGKYIPEALIPEIQETYDDAIQVGWEKKGGFLTRPGTDGSSIEPPTWAPRLYEKAKVDGIDVIVTGVDFYKEYFVKFWWELSSGIWPTDSTMVRKAGDYEALLGGTFAGIKGLTAGHTITINGTKFNAVGVLEETNTSDDFMVFIPLKTAQKLFNKEGFISLLGVRAMCNNCPVGDAAVELNKKVTGITSISQMNIAEAQYEFLNMLYKFLLAIVAATLIVGFFTIFNTITGALYARVKEVGLLKAMGVSRLQLVRLFLYQHVLIGLIGGTTGFVIGIGLSYILNSVLDIGAVIRVNPQFFWIALSLGIICSVIAILYPAIKLSRVKVTDTFRTQWEV